MTGLARHGATSCASVNISTAIKRLIKEEEKKKSNSAIRSTQMPSLTYMNHIKMIDFRIAWLLLLLLLLAAGPMKMPRRGRGGGPYDDDPSHEKKASRDDGGVIYDQCYVYSTAFDAQFKEITV